MVACFPLQITPKRLLIAEAACDKLGIKRQMKTGVEKISPQEEQWTLEFKNGPIQCDAVIVTWRQSKSERL